MKNLAFMGLGALIIYTLSNASGPDDLELQKSNYCEMVALHKDTAGRYGWPDYRDIFEDECK